MSFITISSDLGENNFSLSILLARLKEMFSSFQVIPLYQQDDIYDIESIAYHIRGALNVFPEKTIHLIFCKYSLTNYDLILTKINNQYIISSDNGVSSLVHDNQPEINIYKISSQLKVFEFIPYLESYTKLIQSILENNYSSLLEPNPSMIQTKPFNTGLMIYEDRIITRVVSISSTGSIILNLSKKQFYEVVQEKPFYIQFVTIKISSISPNYKASDSNNKMGAIFNEAGFLEIFMIGGHVARLFNINKYSNSKIEIIIGHDPNSQIKF